MPGTKCIIPWCDRVCTTVICALCRGRISRIKSELGGVGFSDRPEAFKSLWDPHKDRFGLGETARITDIPYWTLAPRYRHSHRVRRATNKKRTYILSRIQVLRLARMKRELEQAEQTGISLTEAAKIIGVAVSTLSEQVAQGAIAVFRPVMGKRIFLTPEEVERVAWEKNEVVSLSAAARELESDPRTLQRAIKAGRVFAVVTKTTHFSTGVERKELGRVKALYVVRKNGNYLSIPRAAKRLSVSEGALRRWLNSLEIKTQRLLNGHEVISRNSLKKLRPLVAREKVLIGWRKGANLLGVHERVFRDFAVRHDLAVERLSGLKAITPEGLRKAAKLLGIPPPNN